MESTYEKFRKLRDNLGYTQEEFAEILGVSPGTIYNWENERVDFTEKKLKAIFKIAQYLKPKKDKLIQLRQEVTDVINKFNHHPGINVWAETGAGDRYIPDPNQDQPMEVIQIENFINPRYRDCFKVRGTSMLPVIYPGALVFVDFADKKPVTNNMYVLNIPSEGLVVKKLLVQAHQIIIRSYNPEVDDDIIHHEDLENNIAGKVVLIHQEVL